MTGAPASRGDASSLLAAQGLTRRFGGVVALDSLDFDVASGEIVGLIGPNGSGKTTFFNVITGIYAARLWAGVVRRSRHHTFIAASDLPCWHIAYIPALAAVAAAVDLRQHHDRQPQAPEPGPVVQPRAAVARSGLSSKPATPRRKSLVAVFDAPLAERMMEPVTGLPMIDRRRIEICRALISRPKLLLLDEPSAGMTHEETDPTHGRHS